MAGEQQDGEPVGSADPSTTRTSFPGVPALAFVDASGNTDLDTSKMGATRFFVLTAVLTNADKVNELRSAVDDVRARNFGTGEMKSSAVRGDDRRRFKVIGELAALDFRFVALVADKTRIDPTSGLAYKGSFLKFLHEMLFGRLYAAHPDLKLTADEHGSPEFMAGFERYVAERRPVDLFRRPEFKFAASDGEPLLQLADMISGTLRRLHEESSEAVVTEPLRALLRLRCSTIVEWPLSVRRMAAYVGASEHDAAVREFCLGLVVDFIERHAKAEDVELAAQVAMLRFLLVQFNAVSEAEYVSTDSIRSALADLGLNPPSEQAMRARVIARLRDHGVILASSHRGYKIPASVADLMSFVERTDATVYPMIQRLQRARERISLLTSGTLDLLAGERFHYLRAVLDAPLPEREHRGEDEPD